MLKALSKRLSLRASFDAFLTHEWGKDEHNHQIVSDINRALKESDVVTWFDEDRMEGNIPQQMADGIDRSKKVVVFVTRRYMEKVNQSGHDNCKKEFQHAAGRKTLIPVVLDPEMLDQKKWFGTLNLEIGPLKYIDMSTPDKRKANMAQLIEKIKE